MIPLKTIITNIEHLEGQKQELVDQINAVINEAKSSGYNPKIIRKIIALRKKTDAEIAEENELIELYQQQLEE